MSSTDWLVDTITNKASRVIHGARLFYVSFMILRLWILRTHVVILNTQFHELSLSRSCVVVVVTLSRSFYPTSAVPPVSFLILHPRDTKFVVTDSEREKPKVAEESR